MLDFNPALGRTSAMIALAGLTAFAACDGSHDPGSSATGSGGAGSAVQSVTSGGGATVSAASGPDSASSVSSASSASSATTAAGAGGATAGASASVAASVATVGVGVSVGVGVTTGGGCVSGPIPANTLRGTVTYPGPVGPKDVLRVIALENFQPGSPAGTAVIATPTFPAAYEITGLPAAADAGTFYGVLAYLDVNGDDLTGPGGTDPRASPAMIVLVSNCSGGTIDVAIP